MLHLLRSCWAQMLSSSFCKCSQTICFVIWTGHFGEFTLGAIILAILSVYLFRNQRIHPSVVSWFSSLIFFLGTSDIILYITSAVSRNLGKWEPNSISVPLFAICGLLTLYVKLWIYSFVVHFILNTAS